MNRGKSTSQKLAWRETCRKSEIVVLGSLSNVRHEVFYYIEATPFEDSKKVRYYDTAEIEIEESLKGSWPSDRIPVTWFSKTRIRPALEDIIVGSTAEKHVEENKRGVWIIFKNSDAVSQPFSEFYRFDLVPIDSLETVRKVVREQSDQGNAHDVRSN